MLKEIEQEDLMWKERRASSSSKKEAKVVPDGEAVKSGQERKPKGVVDDTLFL